jgi:hypothetical protein
MYRQQCVVPLAKLGQREAEREAYVANCSAGAAPDQKRAETFNRVSDTCEEVPMRTQFHVALFQQIDDPTPFATIPVLAKMPIGALVFALNRLHVTRVAHVVVAWEDEKQADSHYETDFYNVVMGRSQLKYDCMVESASTPGEAEP